MKGARPLSNDEIRLVAEQFDGVFAVRNRSLFMLGVSVGGRISEMLALTIGDVWQNGGPVKDLLFEKNRVKGKQISRMVPVNADGQRAIADLITWCRRKYGALSPDRPMFPSRQGDRAVSRGQAHKVLDTAFTRAGLNGKLATHSLRKSFAQRAYDHSGDIFLVQEMLGHAGVETTREYLGVSYQKMQKTVAKMETLGKKNECNKLGVLYHSQKTTQKKPEEISDDAILIQAIKRGLIDPNTIVQSQAKPQVATKDDKVILMRRKANAER